MVAVITEAGATRGAGLASLLCCPEDGMTLEGDTAREVGCVTCGAVYPAHDGILRFLRESDLVAVQRDEVGVRDREADRYDGEMPPMSDSVEMPLGLKALGVRPGDAVAEVGCGTGRFTLRYAASAAAVAALDFSAVSLARLRDRLRAETRARVLLVQADGCRPPLRPGAFTRAASFNILQHIPGDGARRAALARWAALPAPGGPFVLTAYHWSLHKQRLAARGEGDYTAKEGRHPNGLYYYNFEEAEMRAMFAEAGLEAGLVQGLILGFRGGRLLGPLLAPLNRLIAGTRWCRRRSHYLLLRGVRRTARPEGAR